MVDPFAMRNGSNKHFAKTDRLPACCLQNRPGGPFFMGTVPARNAPTRIGSGPSTNCGRTSNVVYKSPTSKTLALAKRLPIDNSSSTSKLLALTRRLPVNSSSSTSKPLALARRLHTANSSLTS